MNIAITGYKGMLGSELVNTLRDYGHNIIKIGRDSVDITDRDSTVSLIKQYKPDILIHAAAFTSVDDCEKKAEYTLMVNAGGTLNVAEGCKSCGAKMIYISTDYVFDGEKNTPYLEEDITNPLNVYGRSKLIGESNVVNTLDDYIIIRTSWLYGTNGPNFVDTIKKLAISQKKLRVVYDQTGSPTSCKDLAYAISNLIKNNGHGIINTVSSGYSSWYGFAKKITSLCGIEDVNIEPINSYELNRPARRPKNSMLDCNKYYKITGESIPAWENGLTQYLTEKKGISI